jgi:hypothetical protein
MKFFQKTIPYASGQAIAFLKNVCKLPAFYSFTVILTLLSIQLFLISPFYMTADDIFKVLIVKGIASNSIPTPYVPTSNILMGNMLIRLFAWIPSFPWYGWFLCAVQFLTFWCFLWLLCQGPFRWLNLALFISLWMTIFFIFFVLFQFNMTALLAAFVGLMVLFTNAESFGGGHNNGILALSSLLLLLSALIRMDSLLLALLVSAPLIISRSKEKHFRDFAKRRWGLLILVFLGVLFLEAANFVWYQSDKSWNEYYHREQARIILQEYQVTQYTPETKPYFDSVGWSENDYWLFKHWYQAGPVKFNETNFKKLGSFFPRIGSSGKTYSCHSLIELFSCDWDLRLALCFFLLLIFSSRSSRIYLLVQWFWILLVFLILIYFYKTPDRVNMPILAFLVMLSVFYTENPLENQTKAHWFGWVKAFVLLVAFVFSLSLPWRYYQQNYWRRLSQDQMHRYLTMLNSQDNQLYVVWTFPFEEFGVFDNLESLKPFHLSLNAYQDCPFSLKGLERFGVRDPLRDAVDNPNVFFICSAEEGWHYHQYMKETYHEKIYAVPVFKSKYFETFTIHSKKNTEQTKSI